MEEKRLKKLTGNRVELNRTGNQGRTQGGLGLKNP